MIKYYKLFDLLNRMEMKKTDLLKVISAPTLAKLSKGQNVQTDVIDKICQMLKCQPNDIMEVISKNEKGQDIKYILNEMVIEDNHILQFRTIEQPEEKEKEVIKSIDNNNILDTTK